MDELSVAMKAREFIAAVRAAVPPGSVDTYARRSVAW